MDPQKLYQKGKSLIPGGTQLFSKRPERFLPGLWPSYYTKAKDLAAYIEDEFDMTFPQEEIAYITMHLKGARLLNVDTSVPEATEEELVSAYEVTRLVYRLVEAFELISGLHIKQDELLISGLFSEDVTLGKLTLSHFDGFQNYVTCLNTGTYTFIDQALSIPGLKVFPNPASDHVQVLIPGQSSRLNYSIYNAIGSLMTNGTLITGDYIDLSLFPAGHYLLRLSDNENRSSQSLLLIKQ